MRLPKALQITSTATSPDWLRTSRIGLSSVTSRLRIRPVSLTISMSRLVCCLPVAEVERTRYWAPRTSVPALGPRVGDAESGDLVFGGSDRVVHVDPAGNLVTNVEASRAAGCAVEVGGAVVAAGQRWGDAAPGSLLAYGGSFGLLEVAARDDSAARRLGIGVGAAVSLQNA